MTKDAGRGECPSCGADLEARERFEEMVAESHEYWPLWQSAFMAAMNTGGSFRSFLRKVRDGTALDWWKSDFLEGVRNGDIVARDPEQQEWAEDIADRYGGTDD